MQIHSTKKELSFANLSIKKQPDATDSGYIAKVSFANGLKTNYNKPIQYKDGLLAQGEIITEDLKLSDRLINSIKKIFKQ